MTYGELPTTRATGRTGLQPQMMCDDCGDGPWSAEHGDYFMHPYDEEVTCGECGGAMVLVREVHYYERVR